jgi:hypothetical protein
MRWSNVLLLLAALDIQAASQEYNARLTPVAFDGATRDNVQGDGHVTAQLNGNRLTVSGDFTALPSAATSVRLYSGPGIGVPGPAIQTLQFTGQADGAISGSVTLTKPQMVAFKSGHVYVQLDSQKAPDGNLWGWLLPIPPFPGADVPVAGDGFVPQLAMPGNWTEK